MNSSTRRRSARSTPSRWCSRLADRGPRFAVRHLWRVRRRVVGFSVEQRGVRGRDRRGTGEVAPEALGRADDVVADLDEPLDELLTDLRELFDFTLDRVAMASGDVDRALGLIGGLPDRCFAVRAGA